MLSSLKLQQGCTARAPNKGFLSKLVGFSIPMCLVPRPHSAHARRKGLVSQVQILGLAPEGQVTNEIAERRLMD